MSIRLDSVYFLVVLQFLISSNQWNSAEWLNNSNFEPLSECTKVMKILTPEVGLEIDSQF